jgi:hypothetical protein
MFGDVNDKKGSGFKVRGSEVKRLDSFIFFRFIDFDGRG